MEQNAYIMEAISGVIYLVLGLRLCWRSVRSGEWSEQIFGLALLIWATGYALYDIPYAFTKPGELIPPFFSYTSALAFNLGNLTLAVYAKDVFRKRENWAGWLVVALACCALLGATGSAWVGDWEQVDPLRNPGYWPQTLANVAPAFWIGCDGLTHFFAARKRVALGLVDPWPHNQMLLFGLVGSMWSVLEILVVVQVFVYVNLGAWSLPLGIANGLLELLPMGLLWLVFFPPAAYRRWIEGAAPA